MTDRKSNETVSSSNLPDSSRDRSRISSKSAINTPAESRAVCQTAIACAEETGARSDEARARNMLGSSLVALGDVEAGLAELERSRDLAREVGPPELLVVVHHNLALNLAQAGRMEAALTEVQAGREVARRTDHQAALGR